MDLNKHQWDFENLVGTIRQVYQEMAAQAGKAVNLSLTLRNWLIGFYITVYEQNGSDRAGYGVRLLEDLSSRLAEGGIDGFASRSLRQYRQFYLVPGNLADTVCQNLEAWRCSKIRIAQSQGVGPR